MNNNELNTEISNLSTQLLGIINEALLPLPIKKIVVENIYLTVASALEKSVNKENM